MKPTTTALQIRPMLVAHAFGRRFDNRRAFDIGEVQRESVDRVVKMGATIAEIAAERDRDAKKGTGVFSPRSKKKTPVPFFYPRGRAGITWPRRILPSV